MTRKFVLVVLNPKGTMIHDDGDIGLVERCSGYKGLLAVDAANLEQGCLVLVRDGVVFSVYPPGEWVYWGYRTREQLLAEGMDPSLLENAS